MTDNLTTELREKLTERGIDYIGDIASRNGVRTTHWKNGCNIVFQAIDFGMDDLLIQVALTPEQAIAATLGEKTRDKTEEWLLKACNQATQDYVVQLEQEVDELKGKLEAATLGSERHPYEQRITGDGSDWGEIMRDAYDSLMATACESCTPEQMGQLADYIRAELGSGTCELEPLSALDVTLNMLGQTEWGACSECGCAVPMDARFCTECGKAVER